MLAYGPHAAVGRAEPGLNRAWLSKHTSAFSCINPGCCPELLLLKWVRAAYVPGGTSVQEGKRACSVHPGLLLGLGQAWAPGLPGQDPPTLMPPRAPAQDPQLPQAQGTPGQTPTLMAQLKTPALCPGTGTPDKRTHDSDAPQDPSSRPQLHPGTGQSG